MRTLCQSMATMSCVLIVPAGSNELILLFPEDLLGEPLTRDPHSVKVAYTVVPGAEALLQT